MPATIALRPGAPSRLEVAYRPLLAGEAAAVVAIAAPRLGPLRYGLRLLAAAAAPLRPLSFGAVLGSSQSQVHIPHAHAHAYSCQSLHVKCLQCTCFAPGCCACVYCMLLYCPMCACCCALLQMACGMILSPQVLPTSLPLRGADAAHCALRASESRVSGLLPERNSWRVLLRVGQHQRASGWAWRMPCGGGGVL